MTKARESSRSHFDHLDTDRDNRVRVAELIGYITEHFRISYGEAVELVGRMDQDGDGLVSYAEFEPHFNDTLRSLQ
jgi:Ca2+-binding EF-hand superfamily protein